MIDFHSHILPGIDDGSQSVEQSLEMLEESFAQGVTHMVATPHFYASRMNRDSFLKNREIAYERLLYRGEDTPEILLGAEVAYYHGMSRSDAVCSFQIQDTGVILVEMPYRDWTDRMMEDLRGLRDRQGLTPVLAHVDRYRKSSQFPRYGNQLLDMGIYCQCNAECFQSFFFRRWAVKQFRQGTVQLLGSDCHDLVDRAPNLSLAMRTLHKKLGVQCLEEITDFSAELLCLHQDK